MTSGIRCRATPERSRSALILVDVINDLDFEGGEKLLRPALRIAPKIAALAARARRSRVPVIYANDNFGHWRSDFAAHVQHCMQDDVRGEPFVKKVLPEPSDYFVLKPRHSAFFATVLDTLLDQLGVEVVVLAGLAGDSCVLYTAHDAHMRGYQLFVPHDAVASERRDANRWALAHMQKHAHADTRSSSSLRWSQLKAKGRVQRARR